MMRVAIYSPYLDSFGGGERYMLTIAETLAGENKVDVLLDSHLSHLNPDKLKRDLAKRLNIDLEKVNFIPAPIGGGSSIIKRLLFLKQYDVLFYLTDGSIFYSTAKKNILHIQSPLINPKINSVKNSINLKSWNRVMYNSIFTQKQAEKYWSIKGVVIYPPVDIDNIHVLPKKQYILSVGRFFGYLKSKKHDEMIQSFIKMYKNNKLSGWSLHLVGSATEGDEDYVSDLKKQSEGYPIYLYPNLSFDKLMTLYGESSIYWHAAGFNETDPTKMEHFGISTVEAMAAGCIPVVINRGGQPEIVEDSNSGLLWNSLDELISDTLTLIKDTSKQKIMRDQAIKRARDFSKNSFVKQIKELVQN